MTAKPKVELPPLVRDFLSITLLVMPGALLLLVWAGAMWFLLKQPDSASTNLQSSQARSSPSSSPSSTAFSDLLLALVGVGSLLKNPTSNPPAPSATGTPANSPQVSQEELKGLQLKVKELSNSNATLTKQLEEIKTANSADDKVYDLVIAALGSLVAVAVIVPSVTVISKAISDQNERSRIQEDIQKELRKEFDRQLGEIQAYLLLKDYEISNLSIHQTISEIDLKNIKDNNNIEIAIDDSLNNWVANPSKEELKTELKNKISQIPAGELRKLKVHRYPLVLQDIAEALQAQKYLYSLDLLPANDLDHLVEQQLELFLFLLVLMNYAHEDKDKYILPRISERQLKEFKSTFEDLHDFFNKTRPRTKCSKIITQIHEILLSTDLKKDFANVLRNN